MQTELQAHLAVARERKSVPVLAQLRAHGEAIARAEMERTLGGLVLSEKQEKSVRAMAQAIVNKLLHGPTTRLRAEGGGPLSEAATQLFALEEPFLTVVAAPCLQRSQG